MQKILWSIIFLLGTPAVITWAVVILLYTSKASGPQLSPIPTTVSTQPQIFSSSDLTLPEISTGFTLADARPKIIKKYLERYGSELIPLSDQIVSISDKYKLDFRLLVAIAQQESNLCKKIPNESYNCWGFGIYGDKVTRFSNYSEGLETVAKTLKSKYIDKGLTTPEKIMAKYTPPSLANGGSWAKGVNTFLAEME